MYINKKIANFVLCSAIVVLFLFTNLYTYSNGLKEGYFNALTDMKDKLDIEFTWTRNTDGTYTVSMWRNGQILQSNVQVDCYVQQEREGILLSAERHAGVLTDLGADWIEKKLSSTQNVSEIAKYVTCSASASAPSDAWSVLPSEIDVNGLSKAAGTYTSTGVGVWTIVKAFSVTGTQAVQLYGLNWEPSVVSASLLCSDTSAVKNCVNGDTLTVTWTLTLS